MKITLVAPPYFAIPPAGYGGIEAVVADLADGLVDRGHQVTLLCAGPSGTKACELRILDEPEPDQLGDPLFEVMYAAATARTVADLVAGGAVDVVHDHTLAGPLAAGGRSVPTVVTCHGPTSAAIRRMYADLAGAIGLVAISERQRALAPELPWVGTVYNAVRVEDYPFRGTSPADGEFALFLGRMSPEKAPHLALEAAHAAGIPLVLAGKCSDPGEREYYEAEVAPRLREGDEMVGVADAARKRDLLVRARCLLMPIQWEEPFGMVLVEAAACGTPVVAVGAGAVPEIVSDGVTGIICDVDGFPEAIEKVGSYDPQACRDHVAQHFSVERMAAGYELAYETADLTESSVRRLPTIGHQVSRSAGAGTGVAAALPAAP